MEENAWMDEYISTKSISYLFFTEEQKKKKLKIQTLQKALSLQRLLFVRIRAAEITEMIKKLN